MRIPGAGIIPPRGMFRRIVKMSSSLSRLMLAVIALFHCSEAQLFVEDKTLHASVSSSMCVGLPSASLSTEELLSKMKSALNQTNVAILKALEDDHSPGGAVVSLVYRDALLWTGGYGLKDMSSPHSGPPTENTAFRIGSVTKLFAALQTLLARDSGKLGLDEDITKYYPEFSIKNPFQTKRGITFRQLMSHMSGLPRNTPCEGLFETGCNLTDAEILKNIQDLMLVNPPGRQPLYSNLGFGLLGKVLVKIAGSASWDDLLTEVILKPLGMKNTGNKFSATSDMAVGYYADGSVAGQIDVGWDASAGQAHSSTADLAKLMTLIFNANSEFIDGETLREWLQPAYIYPGGSGFSFPWELFPLGNYTLHTKDGRINGYTSEFEMAIESKVGFIFLQSCHNCKSHQVIQGIAQELLLTASSILAGSQPPPPAPPNPQEYVGVYQSGQGNVNVSMAMVSGHSALVVVGMITVIFEWRYADSFQISVGSSPVPCFFLSSGSVGAWVHFQRDSVGKVTSLTLPGLAYGKIYTKH